MSKGIFDFIDELIKSHGFSYDRKVSRKLFSRKDLDELISELDELEIKFRKFLKKVK